MEQILGSSFFKWTVDLGLLGYRYVLLNSLFHTSVQTFQFSISEDKKQFFKFTLTRQRHVGLMSVRKLKSWSEQWWQLEIGGQILKRKCPKENL